MEIWIPWAGLVLAILNSLVLLLVLRELAILRVSGGARRSGLKLDQTLPAVSARTVNGEVIDLGIMRRKLLLFLSPNCELCRSLVDALRGLAPGSLPPMVVAVTNYGALNASHPFVRSLGFVDAGALILDEGRQIYSQLEIPVTPWAYALNEEGRVRGSGVPSNVDELREMASAIA